MPFVIDIESHPLFLEGEEKGLQKGIKKLYEEKLAIASSLLDILDDKTISERVKLPLEVVEKLRKEEK
jgi:hypothetical protein